MRWFLGASLLLLAALLLDSGLLAYAMYVLLGLLVVSRFLARRWIGSLHATRACRALTAEVGDRVGVTLTVHNRGALPVPWVLLEDLLPRATLGQKPPRLKVKGKRVQISMLAGGAEVTLHYQLICKTRGYYQIGP